MEQESISPLRHKEQGKYTERLRNGKRHIHVNIYNAVHGICNINNKGKVTNKACEQIQ